MTSTRLFLVAACLGAASVATAGGGSLPNWIVELLGVRAAQTSVVRDPMFPDQYLLCWQGRRGERYAGRFSGQSLQDGLQVMSPGQRSAFSGLIGTARVAPSARDAEVCWQQ